jgi:hypothetical protein
MTPVEEATGRASTPGRWRAASGPDAGPLHDLGSLLMITGRVVDQVAIGALDLLRDGVRFWVARVGLDTRWVGARRRAAAVLTPASASAHALQRCGGLAAPGPLAPTRLAPP